jgi:hypothetical protein
VSSLLLVYYSKSFKGKFCLFPYFIFWWGEINQNKCWDTNEEIVLQPYFRTKHNCLTVTNKMNREFNKSKLLKNIRKKKTSTFVLYDMNPNKLINYFALKFVSKSRSNLKILQQKGDISLALKDSSLPGFWHSTCLASYVYTFRNLLKTSS